MPEGLPLLMDRAYEGNETRQLVLELGITPVVPPKSNRIDPWRYDRALYRKRNEIERLFRRLKGYRRIFSRFEKLDCVFLACQSLHLPFQRSRGLPRHERLPRQAAATLITDPVDGQITNLSVLPVSLSNARQFCDHFRDADERKIAKALSEIE